MNHKSSEVGEHMEEAMNEAGERISEKVSETRSQASQAMQQVKDNVSEKAQEVRSRVMEQARLAGEYVERKPWNAVGIAALAGLFIGLLLKRNRHDYYEAESAS